MYSLIRRITERILRIPPQPEPPPGDETTTRVFNAAPNFYRYLLVVWALRTLGIFAGAFPTVLGLPAVFLHATQSWGIGQILTELPTTSIVVLVGWRLIALSLIRLDFEKRWYLVTNRSLRLREGVVLVREMTITIANIQNITISQGPIQRLLGIADLRVQTAGGGKAGDEDAGESHHLVRFRGVNNAHEIRELIQKRLRHLRDSGLGDSEQMSIMPATGSTFSENARNALREIRREAIAFREALSHGS